MWGVDLEVGGCLDCRAEGGVGAGAGEGAGAEDGAEAGAENEAGVETVAERWAECGVVGAQT